MIDENKLETYKAFISYAEGKLPKERLDEYFREIHYGELKAIHDTIEALWKVARAADKLAGMFGTVEHPVQGWYEDEFCDLEGALCDLKEPK